jgi:hypothetical protein
MSETFETHESRAEPGREVEPARSGAGPRRRGVLVAAAGATAVALIAVGTSYGARGRQADGARNTSTGGGHRPPLPPQETDAGNRAAAATAAATTLAAIGSYPGASASEAIRELGDDTLSTVAPAGRTEVRSAFWVVSGAGPTAVARWYAAHPPTGFSSGGADAVGGQGDGRTWISEVYYDQGGSELGARGTSAEVQTTTLPSGVGIRATVSSVWAPARPRASYVQDVTSIDVRSVHLRYGRDTVERSVRSFTVTDPARVLHAAVVFNSLSGMTPMALPCPMAFDAWIDRLVLHTATGDVSVVGNSSACGGGLTVRRDGRRVGPVLAGADSLYPVLGLRH